MRSQLRLRTRHDDEQKCYSLRMGLFGSSREQRQAECARALAPYGFRFTTEVDSLRNFLPMKVLSTPSYYYTHAAGTIEDARVELFHYGSTSRDSDGKTSTHEEVAVGVFHPALEGSAQIRPDHAQWGGVAAAFDLLFWIPPFTFLKLFQAWHASAYPDWNVGHPEFDRLYYVTAEDGSAAVRAVQPALRAYLLQQAFRGAIDLRSGVFFYTMYGISFRADHVVQLLSYARPLLHAARKPMSGRHPMR